MLEKEFNTKWRLFVLGLVRCEPADEMRLETFAVVTWRCSWSRGSIFTSHMFEIYWRFSLTWCFRFSKTRLHSIRSLLKRNLYTSAGVQIHTSSSLCRDKQPDEPESFLFTVESSCYIPVNLTCVGKLPAEFFLFVFIDEPWSV